MMRKFRIWDGYGKDLGVFEGQNEEGALESMARNAGYNSHADMVFFNDTGPIYRREIIEEVVTGGGYLARMACIGGERGPEATFDTVTGARRWAESFGDKFDWCSINPRGAARRNGIHRRDKQLGWVMFD